MELTTGQTIRPEMDCKKAVQLVESLYGFTVLDVRQLDGYDDRNFYVSVSLENHSNPHVERLYQHGYVLKVTNSIDSQKPHVDGEHAMMRTLNENNIECPLPVVNVHGEEKSMEKLDDGDVVYMVRLLTYVPGDRVETVPYTSQLLYQLGQTIASFNNALQNLHHPALSRSDSRWCLSAVPQLRQFTHAVDDANRRLVLDVIDTFEREVIPNMPQFSAGIIHGDFNEQNVLVRQQSQSTDVAIVGVIDFEDSHHGPYVFELAIAVTYCMLQSRVVDPLDVCGHLVAGYLSRRQRALSGAERAALWPSVAARLAQSLTIGAHTYSLDPSNAHVLVTAKRGWTVLRQMWKETSRQQLETTLDVVLNGYGYRLPAA